MTYSTRVPSFPANLSDYAPWVTTHGLVAPYGECQCGCGATTAIAKVTNGRYGHAAGEPVRFIFSHGNGPRLSLVDVFWQNVNRGEPDVCWEWNGRMHTSGYGTLSHNIAGKYQIAAHRASYIVHHGEIPDGLWVLHKCDNRRCVNPAHLFLGTHDDNMADMVAKGRAASTGLKGQSHPGAKLTEEHVREIKTLHKRGVSCAEIARHYKVSSGTIRKIINGKGWTHVSN